MFQLGSDAASSSPQFVPDSDARAWIAEALATWAHSLGAAAATPVRDVETALVRPSRGSAPSTLDGLFDLICRVQEVVGQRTVEFSLHETGPDAPALPVGFEPLGESVGHFLHTYRRDDEYALLYVPAIFRVPELLLASVARELGRIAVVRAGAWDVLANHGQLEGEIELAAVSLGLGVWVANGAYVFEQKCCGGGCGVDLKGVRTGLSMPEACFAGVLDTMRRGLSRRAFAKHLAPTQKAAFKASWKHVGREPQLSLAAMSQPRISGGSGDDGVPVLGD
ncbi:MAG: hypothetical protein V3V08_03335 [Nannocystaceae bacterium]